MLGTIKKFLFLLIIAIFLLLFFWIAGSKKTQTPQKETFSTLSISPAEKQTGTIIFLHGLADNAENWQKELRLVTKNYPSFKFVIPKTRKSYNEMVGWWVNSWYNIKGSRKDIMSLKEDKEDLLKSVSQIEQIIQEEINNGIAEENIIVAGFSQGGAVALAVGLTTKHKLGGIVCLNGFLPCREEIFDLAKEENKKISFSFYSNSGDDRVPFVVGKQSAELLKQKGYQVKFKENRKNGHFYSQEEINNIISEELKKLPKK